MTKLKENKRRLIPRYAVLPLLSVLVMNFVTYYLTSCLTAARLHVQMALPLDAQVPFVPAFIVVYILAYGQWGIGYVLIARESEAVGSRILSGEILAKAICICQWMLRLINAIINYISSMLYKCAEYPVIHRLLP